MRTNGRKRQFVTPQKSMSDRVSEALYSAVDDVLSKILGGSKPPRKLRKNIKDDLILYNRRKR